MFCLTLGTTQISHSPFMKILFSSTSMLVIAHIQCPNSRFCEVNKDECDLIPDIRERCPNLGAEDKVLSEQHSQENSYNQGHLEVLPCGKDDQYQLTFSSIDR